MKTPYNQRTHKKSVDAQNTNLTARQIADQTNGKRKMRHAAQREENLLNECKRIKATMKRKKISVAGLSLVDQEFVDNNSELFQDA